MRDREREIGELLDRIAGTLQRDIARHSGELGLSAQEWAALRHISVDARGGEPFSTPDSVLERVEMGRGQLRDVVDGLVARGLVESVWGHGWRLSAAGMRIIEPLLTISQSIMTKATSGLTREEMENLAFMLRRVGENLGAPGPRIEED